MIYSFTKILWSFVRLHLLLVSMKMIKYIDIAVFDTVPESVSYIHLLKIQANWEATARVAASFCVITLLRGYICRNDIPDNHENIDQDGLWVYLNKNTYEKSRKLIAHQFSFPLKNFAFTNLVFHYGNGWILKCHPNGDQFWFVPEF